MADSGKVPHALLLEGPEGTGKFALARAFAIRHKAPLTVFLLSGIFPLVPGAGIYNTAYYFLQDDRALFANAGVETLKIALMLALGIALVCSVPLPQNHSTQK